MNKNITKQNIFSLSVHSRSKKIEVIDIRNNNTTLYPSISKAARDLGLFQASISLYIKENRTNPFKGRYIFKLI